MSLRAKRGNLLVGSRRTRGDCFVVPPRNDIMENRILEVSYKSIENVMTTLVKPNQKLTI